MQSRRSCPTKPSPCKENYTKKPPSPHLVTEAKEALHARYRRQEEAPSDASANRLCCVVHADLSRFNRQQSIDPKPQREPKECLEEMARLARSIGLPIQVVSCQTFVVNRPSAATLLGKGQVEALRALVEQLAIELVCLDAPLGALQQRNLERALNCSVLDRTALILKIFAANAQSQEGRLQVARAQCAWQKSRLAKAWQHLERQRGGKGFLAGPGERQIELDKRTLEKTERSLDKKLRKLNTRRALQRRARQGCLLTALTGYTNSGKSTLFNRLLALPQGMRQAVKQQPFLTLDTKIARWRDAPRDDAGNAAHNGGATLLLADTVGFIADLPTFLIDAFNATLEEVVQADIVLHVRDIAAADSAGQKYEVLRVLQRLGCKGRIVEVWNKIDKLPPSQRHATLSAAKACDAVPVSALSGEGCEVLQSLVSRLHT